MTAPMSEGLNYCYSLLYTAEEYQRQTCEQKALLCYENCRKKAMVSLDDKIYFLCLLRATRKECQILINLNLKKRAFHILKTVFSCISEDFHSLDKMFVLTQLSALSLLFSSSKVLVYEKALSKEVRALIEESNY